MCMLTHGNVAVMQYWTVDEAWLSNCVISSVVPGNTSSSEWNPYSQKQQDRGREREGESVYCTCPEHVQSLLTIVCQGCISVPVLKSALSNFSEVLDVLSSTWSLQVLLLFFNTLDLKTSTSASIVQRYLDNCTCYDKIVWIILSAQDGESTDMNCLVFWAHCKIAN